MLAEINVKKKYLFTCYLKASALKMEKNGREREKVILLYSAWLVVGNRLNYFQIPKTFSPNVYHNQSPKNSSA